MSKLFTVQLIPINSTIRLEGERRNFIPYAPFEALKVRDLGSNRLQRYSYYEDIRKDWSNQH